MVAQGTHDQLRVTIRYRHVLGIESVADEEQSVPDKEESVRRMRRGSPTRPAWSHCRPSRALTEDSAPRSFCWSFSSPGMYRRCIFGGLVVLIAGLATTLAACSGRLDDQRRPSPPPFDARYNNRRRRLCRGERCIFRSHTCTDPHGVWHHENINDLQKTSF